MSKNSKPLKFKVGSKVAWTSQAHGGWRMKKGKVVEVVPADQHPVTDELRLPGGPRKHESYVVEVQRGQRAKPKYYWPCVSNLQRVNCI